jgi:hypothetical protein
VTVWNVYMYACIYLQNFEVLEMCVFRIFQISGAMELGWYCHFLHKILLRKHQD